MKAASLKGYILHDSFTFSKREPSSGCQGLGVGEGLTEKVSAGEFGGRAGGTVLYPGCDGVA